jgi:hypothetical protein
VTGKGKLRNHGMGMAMEIALEIALEMEIGGAQSGDIIWREIAIEILMEMMHHGC